MRSAITNLLRFRLPGARVLELFAGTGAIGLGLLEAGAERVQFLERERRIAARLKMDCQRFGTRAQVLVGDVFRVISRLDGQQFEIVIADPPYEQDLCGPTLTAVLRHNLLVKNGILVMEHSRRENPIPTVVGSPKTNQLQLTKQRRFGDTMLSVFEWRGGPEAGVEKGGGSADCSLPG